MDNVLVTPESMREAVGNFNPEVFDDFFQMESARSQNEILKEAVELVQKHEEFMAPSEFQRKVS